VDAIRRPRECDGPDNEQAVIAAHHEREPTLKPREGSKEPHQHALYWEAMGHRLTLPSAGERRGPAGTVPAVSE